MNVAQVIRVAKEWVELQSSQMEGFCGAHLMGGVNWMSKEALFPEYKDVDLNIVLEGKATDWPQELEFRGLILECGRFNAERYSSAEVVLADPELASNLAVNSILSDPKGMLARLHETVAREYARTEWIRARCDVEEARVRQGLQALQHAASPLEALVSAHGVIEGLTGLVAVANLEPPTHRRCLIQMKSLLEKQGRAALQEELLRVLGFASLTRVEVTQYLTHGAQAFDHAVRVNRTPQLGSFKLQPHVRPYLIRGAQEMIEAGAYREAMYWILLFTLIAQVAIQADAAEEAKLLYHTQFERLIADLGWNSLDQIDVHRREAERLAEQVMTAMRVVVKSR